MDAKAVQALRAWIAQQHQALSRASYYSLLGVPQNATEKAIRDSYYQLAARLHPDLYGDALDPETRAKLVSTYSRIVEAYRVLTDGARRAQYDKGLAAGKVRWSQDDERTPRQEDAIKNPHSKRLFLLAQAAAKSGDTKSAIMNLKMAISAEPDSELIRKELAALEARQKK